VIYDSVANLQQNRILSTTPLISVIVPFDEEQAFYTAELRKQTKSKGLSLGDRASIALGMKKNLRQNRAIYLASMVIWPN
jgi:PIN domain nuclease of toxin-antitoxin system